MEYSVETRGWEGNNRREFAQLAEDIILPVVQMNIIIDVPHGHPVRLSRDGNFRIHIWSGAKERNGGSAPERIYGIEVSCGDGGFLPSGKEGAKVFYSGDYAVAELVGKDFFIFHDLCHHGDASERKIFKRLLTELVGELNLSPEEIARRRKEEMRQLKEETAQAAVAFPEFCCVDRTAKEDLEQRLRRGRTEMESLKNEIAKCSTRRSEAREQLEKYAQFEMAGSSYGEEFDKLLAVPGVLGADIEDNKLMVFTSMIRIVYDGKTYVIGRFRIEVNMDASDRHNLKFFNLTNKGKGPGYTRPSGFDAREDFNRHHPHVNEDGIPCLGNLSEAIPQYIMARQYSVVVILALQYLKTVNTEDGAGRGILWWPKEKST